MKTCQHRVTCVFRAFLKELCTSTIVPDLSEFSRFLFLHTALNVLSINDFRNSLFRATYTKGFQTLADFANRGAINATDGFKSSTSLTIVQNDIMAYGDHAAIKDAETNDSNRKLFIMSKQLHRECKNIFHI